MLTRKAFKTGDCVVVAIPKEFRAALKILPGTVLTLQLRDRCIVLSRAVTTPENLLGVDDAGEIVRDMRLETR